MEGKRSISNPNDLNHKEAAVYYDPRHEKLYRDLIQRRYSTHKATKKGTIDKRWVCLTGPRSQKRGNKGENLLSLVLYGPDMNYEGESCACCAKEELWSDLDAMQYRGKKFHSDVYDLLKLIKGCLKPIPQKRKPDWVWCDIEDWERFDSAVRGYNRL